MEIVAGSFTLISSCLGSNHIIYQSKLFCLQITSYEKTAVISSGSATLFESLSLLIIFLIFKPSFMATAADGSDIYPSDSRKESQGAGGEDAGGVSLEERGHVDASRTRLCLFKKQQLPNCL